jgi:hypothetical protein
VNVPFHVCRLMGGEVGGEDDDGDGHSHDAGPFNE